MLTSNGHTVIGNLNENITFDPQELRGVTQVATMPLIMVRVTEVGVQVGNEPD
jgi:hypothetical protein